MKLDGLHPAVFGRLPQPRTPRFGMALSLDQKNDVFENQNARQLSRVYTAGLNAHEPAGILARAEEILALGAAHNKNYGSEVAALDGKLLERVKHAGEMPPLEVLEGIERAMSLGQSHGKDYSEHIGNLTELLAKVIPSTNIDELNPYFERVKSEACPFVPNADIHEKTLAKYNELQVEVPLSK